MQSRGKERYRDDAIAVNGSDDFASRHKNVAENTQVKGIEAKQSADEYRRIRRDGRQERIDLLKWRGW